MANTKKIRPVRLFLFFLVLITSSIIPACKEAVQNEKGAAVYNSFDSLFPIRENGKWGFMDSRAKQVIEPVYTKEPFFVLKKKYCVTQKGGKCELVSAIGKVALHDYDRIRELRDSFLVAVKDGKSYVYMQKQNTIAMIADRLDSIYLWDEYYATVYKKGKEFGYILRNGAVISPTTSNERDALLGRVQYRPDTSFGEWTNNIRSFYIFSEDKGGFQKRYTNTTIGPYKRVTDFSEGLAAVFDGRSWFYIDTVGNKIIPGPFISATSFYNGSAIVDDNTFITKTGKITGKSKYRIVSERPIEGLYKVDAGDDKYPYGSGLVNNTGRMVIAPMQYDGFGEPSEGAIPVAQKQQEGMLWGFINLEGMEIIPLIYKSAGNFKGGYAKVSNGAYWGVIDRAGELVVPLEYTELSDLRSGLIRAEKNGKMLYLNKEGKVAWSEK